jgi:enoyl-CoA hydratase
MSFENIIINKQNNIAVITINRPSQLNALNKVTIHELNSALTELNAEVETRCVIITGAGDKAFVAGADIKEFADFSNEAGAELAKLGQEKLFNYIENMSKPVIAAVNGFALGGGLELALACHMRVIAETAKLSLPEVSLGLIPGYGGTQRLAQLIGKGKAIELIVTAQMISAQEANGLGLANYVVPSGELLKSALTLALRVVANSGTAISSAIKSVNAGMNNNGYATEIKEFGKLFGTTDFREGTAAFLEKRKPKF